MKVEKPVQDMAEVFKALGDPTRLKIIKLLLSRGGQLCVGMLAHELGISQPAVSQQLKVLKNAGILDADKTGFYMHYRVVPNQLESFGLNANEFFKALGSYLPGREECELKGKSDECDAIN
jgi:ArsR family transcriptional regulator